jgi:hypothetical protein
MQILVIKHIKAMIKKYIQAENSEQKNKLHPNKSQNIFKT